MWVLEPPITARVRLWGKEEPACRRGSVPALRRATAIHLGSPSPATSSGLPAGSGGPPSNACAAGLAARLLDLAPCGVYRPARATSGAGELLPHRFTLTAPPRRRTAVCSPSHFPAAQPQSALPTTPPSG